MRGFWKALEVQREMLQYWGDESDVPESDGRCCCECGAHLVGEVPDERAVCQACVHDHLAAQMAREQNQPLPTYDGELPF